MKFTRAIDEKESRTSIRKTIRGSLEFFLEALFDILLIVAKDINILKLTFRYGFCKRSDALE